MTPDASLSPFSFFLALGLEPRCTDYKSGLIPLKSTQLPEIRRFFGPCEGTSPLPCSKSNGNCFVSFRLALVHLLSLIESLLKRSQAEGPTKPLTPISIGIICVSSWSSGRHSAFGPRGLRFESCFRQVDV
ncbi:hypothetical protein ElyMa_000738800 [Elysia marginata]|uniref:Uncharacterized protein n=1 Tax=Elysia marginata TaxID=1093978 RepID=A0AAV4GQ13_9GAST|nr:hypothetical protein ElyMa_000738800 [Elysia marginata]